MASEKSKILVIGGTGYIGKFVVAASVRLGHPTSVLVRDTDPADLAKARLLQSFTQMGTTLVKGDLNDHESLVKTIKDVDVVISAVGVGQAMDQMKLIAAIKEAGTVKKCRPVLDLNGAVRQREIKVLKDLIRTNPAEHRFLRFFPSEFGTELDYDHTVGPAKVSLSFNEKAQIRSKIREEGIPYTFVVNYFFAGYFLPTLSQPGASSPPADKYTIFGDGNIKAIFLDEDDIGTYTIKAVDDPRTFNKTLYLQPANNTLSQNELIDLWERKTGNKFERVFVPEDEVMKMIQESPAPLNVVLDVCYAAYVKGDHTGFKIEPSVGVEASQLYPDVKYTTVDENLNRFV